MHFFKKSVLFYPFTIQLVSEQERIDLEWQQERRLAKLAYNEAMEEYELSRERESVSVKLERGRERGKERESMRCVLCVCEE